MKIVLDVSNCKKSIKPSKDNIIIYDGETWYVTTKKDLFQEYDEHFSEKLSECENKIEECNKKINEMNEFKKDIASQILDMEEIIKNIMNVKGE